MDSDSVKSSFTYMGRKFSDLNINDSSSSAFSDCNSDRSGEFPTASSQSRRLFLACASDNSDEVISQLVSDLDSDNIDEQKQAAMEIRLLAKNKPENRIKIAKAGAIKPLISIISSSDPQLQEYGVTAILNLSLCDENKEEIAYSGAIKPLVRALKVGTPTARENAACALLRLSQVEENKIAIGRCGAILPLVNLLESGNFRGKKDACTALYSLCTVKENKLRAVQTGIMKPLVELMADLGSNMVDKSAFVLSLLVSVAEARAALVDEGGIPVLVEIVEVGTQRQKEIAVAILLQLCEDCLAYRTMVAREGAIPPLVALSQTGTSRAKQKDEIRSPLGAHIFEFCESELFPENLQNSEAASSSNCCYEEHSSSYPTPRTLSITMDHNNMYNTTVDDSNIPPPPPSSAAACSSPSNRNSNLASCMLLEDQTVDDISASIDFTLSPSFHDQPQQYNSNQEPLFNMSNQIQLLGDMAAAEGSLYAPHLYNPEPMVAPPPPVLGPPITKEDYNIRLRSSSSAACTLADPMIGSYISSSSVTAPFSFDSSWLLFTGGSGMLLGTDFSHQELESQGDNGGFFLPDSLARVFNCSSGDLQTLSSSESQHMLNGSPSTTLASEISSLEDPTFKVGKLSAEERKRKIHRYLKKRNERNFSKKIKYACRKTLADSRPRVRGRFAKNDELGELARNTGNNQDDDVDEDVNRMFRNSMPDHHHKAVKDEDSMDPSELFAHMSEVNSFKCNYPIQSWI